MHTCMRSFHSSCFARRDRRNQISQERAPGACDHVGRRCTSTTSSMLIPSSRKFQNRSFPSFLLPFLSLGLRASFPFLFSANSLSQNSRGPDRCVLRFRCLPYEHVSLFQSDGGQAFPKNPNPNPKTKHQIGFADSDTPRPRAI